VVARIKTVKENEVFDTLSATVDITFVGDVVMQGEGEIMVVKDNNIDYDDWQKKEKENNNKNEDHDDDNIHTFVRSFADSFWNDNNCQTKHNHHDDSSICKQSRKSTKTSTTMY